MSQSSSIRMTAYVSAAGMCGLALIAYAASHVTSGAHLLGLMCAAAVASRLSLRIPRITASLSLDVPFVILAAVQMGMSAAVVVAAVATFVQCAKPGVTKASKLMQLWFNIAVLSMSAALAAVAAHAVINVALRFALAAAVLLAANSLFVAVVVALESGSSPVKMLSQLLSWSFPAYVLGAGLASMVILSQPIVGWYIPLALLPVLVLVFQSYKKYFGMVTLVLEEAVKAELEEVMA
jgi:hypothetical protein